MSSSTIQKQMGDCLSETCLTPKKSWDELGLVLYSEHVMIRECSLWSKYEPIII